MPPSILYSILPSSIQGRIFRLPSFRNSVTTYQSTSIVGARDRLGSSGSGLQTPPPAYFAPKAVRGSNLFPESGDSDSIPQDPGLDEERSSSKAYAPSLPILEARTGILWKFANQGLYLLNLAVEESLSIPQGQDEGNAVFGRQLYIHATSYVLRGLPQDLTLEEQLGIRAALPVTLIKPVESEENKQRALVRCDPASTTEENPRSSKTSVLHRILASGIIQICILVQLLIPYVKILIASAYFYERHYHISKRLVGVSIDTVDSIGKRSFDIGKAVSKMVDGKVGQALNSIATWCVEGITGGVYEGIGEGMVIVGARKPGAAQTRVVDHFYCNPYHRSPPFCIQRDSGHTHL
ncbi:MAG: hypothetical protein M1827_007558 [Pycnora praestabilis]|nr:MAG: hypothetical protein M1827_007558 [Pycnora praestabilis]